MTSEGYGLVSWFCTLSTTYPLKIRRDGCFLNSFSFEKSHKSRRLSHQEVTGDQVSRAQLRGMFKGASSRAALPISKLTHIKASHRGPRGAGLEEPIESLWKELSLRICLTQKPTMPGYIQIARLHSKQLSSFLPFIFSSLYPRGARKRLWCYSKGEACTCQESQEAAQVLIYRCWFSSLKPAQQGGKRAFP